MTYRPIPSDTAPQGAVVVPWHTRAVGDAYQTLCNVVRARDWRISYYMTVADKGKAQPFALAVYQSLDDRREGLTAARASLPPDGDLEEAAKSCLAQLKASRLI